MVAESVKNDDYRRLLMMAAVFLASISVAVGMYLLVDMKKQYLK